MLTRRATQPHSAKRKLPARHVPPLIGVYRVSIGRCDHDAGAFRTTGLLRATAADTTLWRARQADRRRRPTPRGSRFFVRLAFGCTPVEGARGGACHPAGIGQQSRTRPDRGAAELHKWTTLEIEPRRAFISLIRTLIAVPVSCSAWSRWRRAAGRTTSGGCASRATRSA